VRRKKVPEEIGITVAATAITETNAAKEKM